MRKGIVLSTCVAALLLLAPAFAPAQQDHQGPPKVITIYREQVKVGKASAHEKFEQEAFVRAMTKANWPEHYLAMTSMSGSSEAWFLNSYDSFAAVEKDTQAMDKDPMIQSAMAKLTDQDSEYLHGAVAMMAAYREDLSYNPGVTLADMRYFGVLTFHVKPGHGEEFKQVMKMVKEAHEKAKVNEHFAVFEVVAGAPGGTYLLFHPMKSLAEMDTYESIHKPYRDTLGEEGLKKLGELQAASIAKVEPSVFAFSPKMSYVSKEWAAGNADFWFPKTTVAAKKPAAAVEKKAVKKEKQ
jgi:hypothetical protein